MVFSFRVLLSFVIYGMVSASSYVFMNVTPTPNQAGVTYQSTDLIQWIIVKHLQMNRSTCVLVFSLIIGTSDCPVESFPTLTVAIKPRTYCTRRHNYQNKEPKKERMHSKRAIDLILCERTQRLLAPPGHESESHFPL